MQRTIMTVLVGAACLAGGLRPVSAKGHTCDKACEKSLAEPTPYRPFENKALKWLGYNDAATKTVIKVRKRTDTGLLERPAVFLLVSDYDNTNCVAAHFERVVFSSRNVVRLTKDITTVRFERKLLGALPKVSKQLKYTGVPMIVVVGIRQEVVARFTKKISAKSVSRALRKALKGQRATRRATRSAAQNLEAAKKAFAKQDYREAGRRLSRVLRSKGDRALRLQAEELLVQLEQAGKAKLKALSKEKAEVIPQYLSLLSMQEEFRPVRKIRGLIERRITALEEGPQSWRVIQEYKGKEQLKAAVALAKAGKRPEARAILKEVERDYVGLACAAKARQLLARISD